MKSLRVVGLVCLFLILLGSSSSQLQVRAQDLGFAQPYPVEGENLQGGHIVSFSQGSYHLSTESYDKSMFGVVSDAPVVEILTENPPGTIPVITNGVTHVLVSTKNGPIKTGDIITSSDIPGIGMKSDKSGFILGMAQSDYTESDPQKYGQISVAIAIKFAFVEDSPESEKIGSRLLDLVKLSTLAAYESPLDTLRYVLASGIVIATLVVTFFTTGKAVRHAIEATGRNPLASKTIMSGMIVNVLLSLAITASGLIAAYFVTTL